MSRFIALDVLSADEQVAAAEVADWTNANVLVSKDEFGDLLFEIQWIEYLPYENLTCFRNLGYDEILRAYESAVGWYAPFEATDRNYDLYLRMYYVRIGI